MNNISDIDYFKDRVAKALRLPDSYLKDNKSYSTAAVALLMQDLYWDRLVKEWNNGK